MTCVSVIIPVYNVERYLDECINSVVTQTYTQLEILLVDDGSTDHSGEMCDEWAQKDARIRVIHKENGGLSDARNAGVTQATGDYILFLDSDDYWDDPQAVEKLMARVELTKPDVLIYSFQKYYEDTLEKKPYIKNVTAMPVGLSQKEQYEYLLRYGLFYASACNKLIKKSLFADGGMTFRKGVFSEDIEWCAKLLCRAESMDFIPDEFYCYRQRKGSISHSIDDKKCKDLHDNLIRCFELFESVSEEVKPLAYRYIAYLYGTFFITQAQAENLQTECLQNLKQYQWILRYHGGNTKIRVLYYCCKVIGYINTCRLLRFVYHKH